MDRFIKNGWLLAVSGVVALALIVLGCMTVLTADRKAPVITVQNVGVTYTKGDSDQVLLVGVTAKDDKDGDVSSSIIVEGMVIMEDGVSAKVCYVAKDKSNNISRAYRVVNYVGDGVSGDGADEEKETQTQDGKPEESKPVESKPEESQSQGDNTSKGANPVLTLKQSEVTIKVGSTFNVVSYVADITDDKDERSELFKRIIADGKRDPNVVGDYTLTIYCTDTEKNESERLTLILHVVP